MLSQIFFLVKVFLISDIFVFLGKRFFEKCCPEIIQAVAQADFEKTFGCQAPAGGGHGQAKGKFNFSYPAYPAGNVRVFAVELNSSIVAAYFFQGVSPDHVIASLEHGLAG